MIEPTQPHPLHHVKSLNHNTAVQHPHPYLYVRIIPQTTHHSQAPIVFPISSSNSLLARRINVVVIRDTRYEHHEYHLHGGNYTDVIANTSIIPGTWYQFNDRININSDSAELVGHRHIGTTHRALRFCPTSLMSQCRPAGRPTPELLTSDDENENNTLARFECHL